MAAIFLASMGAAMVRGVFAARWLGWLSFVAAGFAVLGSMLGMTRTDGGTLVFGYLPAIGALLILLISSIFMLRDRGAVITMASSEKTTATG
jgi:hypothetical protein